jgi:hypothetical protein
MGSALLEFRWRKGSLVAFVLLGVGGLLCLVSAICSIILLVAAFQSSAFDGIASFFCGIYLLYFAIVKYESKSKGAVLAGWFLGAFIGSPIFFVGQTMLVAPDRVVVEERPAGNK